MRIEVLYVTRDRKPRRYRIELPPQADCGTAIAACGVLRDFPEIRLEAGYGIAIYGQRAGWHSALAEGDRVEILRPLSRDPKESRRARARSNSGATGSRTKSSA